MNLISRTEEMLLLAVCRLQEEAFGLTIRKEVEAATGKRYSVGGIYVPLDRLVGKGLLTTEEGLPTEERLGRPRRRYRITPDGLATLREVQRVHERLWSGLPDAIAQQLRMT